MLGDFADVQDAVGAGEKFDESAELREKNDFAEIGFADFGAGGNLADHRESGIATSPAGGKDGHGAVFEDVDLDAGGFNDGADFLAAWTDEVANLVLRDLQFEEAGSVGRNFLAAFAERLFDDVEDFKTGFRGLRERFAHHLNTDAEDLDVHLQCSDAIARAGDLEVHVAVMIFGAGNVRENRILVVLAIDQAHGATPVGGLNRNNSDHEGWHTAADVGARHGT